MTRRPIQILALFSTLALAACGGSAATVAPGTAVSAAPAADVCAKSAKPGTVAVTIKDFEFSPAAVTAKVGDVVAFTNSGSATHTATLDVGDCGTDKLVGGATGGLTFSQAGTYAFHCAIHSSMTGTIKIS